MAKKAKAAKSSRWQSFKGFWEQDRFRLWLFIGGFVYAWVFTLGLPQWDDDFTSWHWNIRDKGFFEILWQWIWPISTQPQYWGFNERPFQMLLYKICHALFGYDAGFYFIWKNLAFAGVWVGIYEWVKRLCQDHRAGIISALLFGLAPGPIVALYYYPDFAPFSALWILVVGLWMWSAIEATPKTWDRFPQLGNRDHVEWIKQWALISFVTYLGYKVKGDVRVLPIMLVGYVVLFRRTQWKLFSFPIGLMTLLAVPWGPGILAKLPPWFPGSQGSEIGWMYKPANAGTALDYVSSMHGFSFWQLLIEPGFSYASVLAPFLLLAMLLFIGLKESGYTQPIRLLPVKTEAGRFGSWVSIWLVLALAVLSALPELNHTFRVRYGIVNLLPASILIGGLMGMVLAEIGSAKLKKLHPNAGQILAWIVGVLLVAQLGFNFVKSARHRTQLGRVMLMVDRAYEAVATQAQPPQQLLLVDGFRSYAYRPLVSDAIENRVADVPYGNLTQYPANTTQFISWKLYLDSRIEVIGSFDGCLSWHPFDWVLPCKGGSKATLYRWLGPSQPLLAQAQQANRSGNRPAAIAAYQQYLNQHPTNYGAMFELTLIHQQSGQYFEANRWEEEILKVHEVNTSVLYNNAISKFRLDQCDAALDNLDEVLARLQGNFGIHYYQFECGLKVDLDAAEAGLMALEQLYPGNGDVQKLRQRYEAARKEDS